MKILILGTEGQIRILVAYRNGELFRILARGALSHVLQVAYLLRLHIDNIEDQIVSQYKKAN